MNLINLLCVFGIKEFFLVAIGLAFIIGLVWVLMKFKDFRDIVIKIIIILLGIALLVSAIVCGYKTYSYFTANSTNWGDFVGTVLNKTEANYLGDYSFKIDNVQFDYTGTANTYKITYQTKELVDIDLNSANWTVYVNDMPTYNNEKGIDYINGDYSYTFYNEDRQEILTDKLAIKFAFYANYAKFTITTTGGETAINLWEDYINKNNFVISLKNSSYVQDNNFIINGVNAYFNISINYNDDGLLDYLSEDSQIQIELINSKNEVVDLVWKDNLKENKLVLLDYGVYRCNFISNNPNLIFSNNETTKEFNYGQHQIVFNCDIYNNDIMVLTLKENDTYKKTYQKVSIKLESSELVKNNQLLYKVEIPPVVEEIGNQVFYDCSELTEVVLSENIIKIGDYSFYLCKKLMFPVLPSSLTHIGSNSFCYCDKFERVYLSNNLEYIGCEAFRNCKNLYLTDINNLQYLGTESNPYFYLINVSIGNASSYEVEKDCKIIGGNLGFSSNNLSITLHNGLISISNNAFFETALRNITIPSSVKYIGYNAFACCDYLTAIHVEENSDYYSSIDGVLYNKEQTELICCPTQVAISEIIIPNTVELISSYAFACCYQFTSITLGNNIKRIGSGAFFNCGNLREITILNSHVIIVEETIFDDCFELTDIYYSGTKQKWHSLSEFSYFNCPTITVHCIDGDIVVN